MGKTEEPARKSDEAKAEKFEKHCGIIMPISSFPFKEFEYTQELLDDILSVVSEGIVSAGLTPAPVWKESNSSIIQSRIINNIRDFPYAVCVICGLNSNVMLETGLAIAFNKRLLIVTDDLSGYPFDLSPMKCIKFPRKGGYRAVKSFSAEVAAEMTDIMKDEHQTYLSFFGSIAPPDNINPQQFVNLAEVVRELQTKVGRLTDFSNKFYPESLFSSGNIPESFLSPVSDSPEFAPIHSLNPYDITSPKSFREKAFIRTIAIKLKDLQNDLNTSNSIEKFKAIREKFNIIKQDFLLSAGNNHFCTKSDANLVEEIINQINTMQMRLDSLCT